MNAPQRIMTLLGGLLFILLGIGITAPSMYDLVTDPNPVDGPGGAAGVVIMLLVIAAAPVFVGVRLIASAFRPDRTGAPANVPQPAHEPSPTPRMTPPLHEHVETAATSRSIHEEAVPPPPPSERRAATAEASTPPHSNWGLVALVNSPFRLAGALALASIPLMILLRPNGAYVGTAALTLFSLVEVGATATRPSWWIAMLTAAGVGMMLFIVLAATAGAIEQGEGNNPVFMLPGLLFYAGIAITGVARLFWRP